MKELQSHCEICGKTAEHYVNDIPLCTSHYLTQVYSDSIGCLKIYLDTLVENVNDGIKLSQKKIKFLNEVKKQFPELAIEYGLLFSTK